MFIKSLRVLFIMSLPFLGMPSFSFTAATKSRPRTGMKESSSLQVFFHGSLLLIYNAKHKVVQSFVINKESIFNIKACIDATKRRIAIAFDDRSIYYTEKQLGIWSQPREMYAPEEFHGHMGITPTRITSFEWRGDELFHTEQDHHGNVINFTDTIQ